MQAACGGSWATLGSRLIPSNLMLPSQLGQIDRRQMYKKDAIPGPTFAPAPPLRPPKIFFSVDKDVSTLC
jgi:hypothetical protein